MKNVTDVIAPNELIERFFCKTLINCIWMLIIICNEGVPHLCTAFDNLYNTQSAHYTYFITQIKLSIYVSCLGAITSLTQGKLNF